MTLPLRSSPITGPSSLLRSGPPLCPASVRSPSRISRLGLSRPPATPGHNRSTGRRGRGTTGSHVPHRSPDQARATSMPDTTWPISRHPPGSIPGWAGRPVSMPSIAVFDTSSVDRSRSPSRPTPDALTARLTPRTLTTTALDRSSSGWFAASPCRATAEDHRPQGPAPPSPMQHRINQSDLLHRPPLRVRGTPCPTTFSQESPRPGHRTVSPSPDSNPPRWIFMPRRGGASGQLGAASAFAC
jgi:hypothetical protein